MRTRQRAARKARRGSARPPKRAAAGRASANLPTRSQSCFWEERDIKRLLDQPPTMLPEPPMSSMRLRLLALVRRFRYEPRRDTSPQREASI
jgi:hypothetical protein